MRYNLPVWFRGQKNGSDLLSLNCPDSCVLGVREHQQSEWNPAGGFGAAGDCVLQEYRLPVYRPETAGSAGRADQFDGGGAFLEQYGSLSR